MREVYAEASEVIAWVGPAADGSDRLISRMKGRAEIYNGVDEQELMLLLLEHAGSSVSPSIEDWFTVFAFVTTETDCVLCKNLRQSKHRQLLIEER